MASRFKLRSTWNAEKRIMRIHRGDWWNPSTDDTYVGARALFDQDTGRSCCIGLQMRLTEFADLDLWEEEWKNWGFGELGQLTTHIDFLSKVKELDLDLSGSLLLVDGNVHFHDDPALGDAYNANDKKETYTSDMNHHDMDHHKTTLEERERLVQEAMERLGIEVKFFGNDEDHPQREA